MTHLYIELNTGLTEEVDNKIIEKLYKTVTENTLDETSDLKGRLHVSIAKGVEVTYLNEHFLDLHISADDLYLSFVDPEVERLLAIKYGDGTGVTNINMASVTELRDVGFYDNKVVTSFPELSQFNNIVRLATWAFAGSSFTTIDLTNIQYIGGESFKECALTGVLNLPNIIHIGDNIRARVFSWATNITEVHIGLYFDNDTQHMGMAFEDCSSLQIVTGLSNITSIPAYLFSRCGNLSSVDIDFSKVTDIQQNAFNGCTSLTSIIGLLHNNITIGGGAFGGCSSLEYITIPSTITLDEGTDHFNNCSKISFPQTLNILCTPNYAVNNKCLRASFRNCTLLKDVVLDSSILYISSEAFSSSGLTSISATGVKYLGDFCFYNVLASKIILPNYIDEIKSYDLNGYAYFSSCSNLQKVVLGHATIIPEKSKFNTDRAWFKNTPNMKCLDVGDSVTEIETNQTGGIFAESGATLESYIIRNTTVPTLTVPNEDSSYNKVIACFGGPNVSIYVPDSVVNDYKAANNWTIIANNIESLKEYTGDMYFYNETFTNGKYQNHKFSDVEIVDTSGSGIIEAYTFKDCTNLTDITLDGISLIKGAAFNGCSSLESIDLLGITINGDLTFYGCTALESIGTTRLLDIFPSGQINASTFTNCTSLQGPFDFTGITTARGSCFFRSGLSGVLNLPDIVNIDNNSVFSSTNITKAVIGDSIRKIYTSCFDGCTSLTEVDIHFSNIPVAEQSSMVNFVKGCTSLQTFDCTGLEKLASGFFLNCTGLTSVTGLDNITIIGSNVFTGCTNLSTIDIDWSKITSIGSTTFLNCTNLLLDYLNIPNITQLGAELTFCNTKIKHIVNLGSITSIPIAYQGCFQNCTELLDATLPTTLTSINTSVFDGCTKLRWIKFLSTSVPTYTHLDQWGRTNYYCFGESWDSGNVYNGQTYPIYVEDSLLSSYLAASGWSDISFRLKPMSDFATDFPNG